MNSITTRVIAFVIGKLDGIEFTTRATLVSSLESPVAGAGFARTMESPVALFT
jgi:hypothetical protein